MTEETPVPQPPVRRQPTSPPHSVEQLRLWHDVRDALYALPTYFGSSLVLQGIAATDLFTFAASLGATIEQQVVDHLNRIRQTTWDSHGSYALYFFERQPQRFPDVVLKTNAPGLSPRPLLGIELKGWYALAKEGEPSFRYSVNPAVCTGLDLLAVFPWALSNVISGSPFLYPPYVIEARFAAEYRNWYWQHARRSIGDTSIEYAENLSHYPLKSDAISDRPRQDAGGNFGRFARTTLMDQFTADLGRQALSGIPVDAWRRFFRVFTENPSRASIDRLVDVLARERRGSYPADDVEQVAGLKRLLSQLAGLVPE